MTNISNLAPRRVPGATFTVTASNVPTPEALKSLGLDEVVQDSMKGRMWSWSAEKINKYLANEHRRLTRMAASNPTAFWKRATFLFAHSDAFLFAALRHVRPKWYEGDSFTRTVDWLWSAQRARQAWRNSKGLKRLRPLVASMELDKPDGSKREVSSPKVQMRLLIYLANYFLAIFLDSRLPGNFHGHRKNRGIPTAWKDILSNMDRYSNIWEFDLRKFHDSISQGFIMESLLQAGLPVSTAMNYVDLCRAQTVLDNEETRRRRAIDAPPTQYGKPTAPWDSGPKTGWTKYVQLRGTPQGCATSALIATWVLNYLGVTRDPNFFYVGYADDGLIMTNEEDPQGWLESVLGPPYSGIYINETKCAWVKKDGQWMKDLKFLGLRLNRKEGRVYASSKSGRNEGLYFEVGDDWLAWLSKVNLSDLVRSPQSPSRVTAEMKQERMSPDRLKNLPVAIARLFWPAEIYEAFAGTHPPWPYFEKSSLKVMLRELYRKGCTMDEEGSFFWDILLNAFPVLTAKVGERTHEPHAIYNRGEPLWSGPDMAKERQVYLLYKVEPNGRVTFCAGMPRGVRPEARYLYTKRMDHIWPELDYYKRNWAHYKAHPFRFVRPYRDKWATMVGAI